MNTRLVWCAVDPEKGRILSAALSAIRLTRNTLLLAALYILISAGTASAEKQGTNEFWNVKVTDIVIAAFTVVLAVVTAMLARYTYRLWRATTDLVRDSGDTARKELRAYVKMSHNQPGLTFETSKGVFRVTIHVKNYGRTPARATNALVKYGMLSSSEPLPDRPDYTRDTATHEGLMAFLVAGDETFLSMAFGGVATDSLRAVALKTKKLWLYGYIDYIDQFGQRHRAGWARLYDPDRDDQQYYPSDDDFAKRSNLVFVTNEGYNYDRERMRGEGNDWDRSS